MTPAEKAEELVYKMIVHDSTEIAWAKKCALIAVDELLEYSKEFDSVRDINGDPFLQEVKKEINKF